MKWKPIKGPEDNQTESGPYLVTILIPWRNPVIDVWDWFSDEIGKTWVDTSGVEVNPPVAWMPLPAPYQPEKEESN